MSIGTTVKDLNGRKRVWTGLCSSAFERYNLIKEDVAEHANLFLSSPGIHVVFASQIFSECGSVTESCGDCSNFHVLVRDSERICLLYGPVCPNLEHKVNWRWMSLLFLKCDTRFGVASPLRMTARLWNLFFRHLIHFIR